MSKRGLLFLSAVAAGCGADRYLVGVSADGGVDGAMMEPPDLRSSPSPDVVNQPDAVVAADRTPVAACSYGAAPIPVRRVAITQQVLASRLSRFIIAGTGIPDGPWSGATTAEVETSVRDWFGSTEPQHLTPHALGVIKFFPAWLGAAPGQFSVIGAFTSGRGGLQRLLTGTFGPPAEQRLGVLSDPDVLTTRAHASTRGTWLQNNLMCMQLPPHPPSIPPPPRPAPGSTYRQTLTRQTADPSCQGCHRLIDPPGFAFENFDERGRFRTMDNGLPVDATGTFTVDGRQVAFDGPANLMTALASSCGVRECFVRRWMEYALGTSGRMLKPQDDAGVREVAAAFAASGDNLFELVVAITLSQPFLAP